MDYLNTTITMMKDESLKNIDVGEKSLTTNPILLLVMIFITTAFVADGYICTNLAVISRNLKLPDSIAGVTLLALGNGVPDLFTAFAGAELDHPEILFAGLTGAGLFDVTLCAGCVIFVRPFYIDSFSWWNLVFYLISYSTMFCGFFFRNLSIWHNIGILVIYLMYGIFTIAHFVLGTQDDNVSTVSTQSIKDDEDYMQKPKTKTYLAPTGRGTLQSTVELLKAMERSRVYKVMGYRSSIRRSADFGYSWRRPRKLFVEFYDFIDFRFNYEWQSRTFSEKVIIVLQLPWIIGLKFLLPAVVPEISINNGWCKLMAMINFLIYPLLLIFCFGFAEVKIDPFPLWQWAILPGVVFFFIIFFTSRTNMQPKYHTVFAYAGFIGAIGVCRLLCTEIVVSLQAIGARLSLSTVFLASTVLAWGNSVTDFVSAASLSRQGLQNMGFSSLYGGPIFNCSIGAALVYIVTYYQGKPLRAFYGKLSPVAALFLLIALIASVILLPTLNFEGRRIMGLYLILLYCMFFSYCTLMETLIHPFGTQIQSVEIDNS
ncbi:putative sodium/calcium exchanger 6 isoform X2 [Halyomorpha halys]|uniref:putative sodium/calcium exchanger 6 isoform X2 n=1 Tax=Halyomorpha halys TaxID=286706 RepID=UPI0006D4D180|nr:putative sodium/calcium exchanger 6 isoform X2 [Halyomorpha halys]